RRTWAGTCGRWRPREAADGRAGRAASRCARRPAGSCARGPKSDSIDALSVARAALREGLEVLPAAPTRPRRQPPDNATIHRIAVTRLHCHPETQDYIARSAPETRAPRMPSVAG